MTFLRNFYLKRIAKGSKAVFSIYTNEERVDFSISGEHNTIVQMLFLSATKNKAVKKILDDLYQKLYPSKIVKQDDDSVRKSRKSR